MRELLGFGFSC